MVPCLPSPPGATVGGNTPMARFAAVTRALVSFSRTRFAFRSLAFSTSAASRVSSSRSCCARRSATRVALFPRPSVATASSKSALSSRALDGSSGETPRTPCAVSALLFDPPLFWLPAGQPLPVVWTPRSAPPAPVDIPELKLPQACAACRPSVFICSFRSGFTR